MLPGVNFKVREGVQGQAPDLPRVSPSLGLVPFPVFHQICSSAASSCTPSPRLPCFAPLQVYYRAGLSLLCCHWEFFPVPAELKQDLAPLILPNFHFIPRFRQHRSPGPAPSCPPAVSREGAGHSPGPRSRSCSTSGRIWGGDRSARGQVPSHPGIWGRILCLCPHWSLLSACDQPGPGCAPAPHPSWLPAGCRGWGLPGELWGLPLAPLEGLGAPHGVQPILPPLLQCHVRSPPGWRWGWRGPGLSLWELSALGKGRGQR